MVIFSTKKKVIYEIFENVYGGVEKGWEPLRLQHIHIWKFGDEIQYS